MLKVNPTIFVAFCMFMTVLTLPAAEGKLITVDDDEPADFSIIQDAISYASKGDEIEVRPGTYYQTVNFDGKAVRLYSSDGPEVTTIDANGAYHVVQCVSSEDANTILKGFTITGGAANGAVPKDQRGGGMYNYQSSPTVTNCTFSSNSASNNGGGMFNYQSSPTVTNCTFSDNSAAIDGGGMYNQDNSSPTITNCIFTVNTAGQYGGGMENYNSSPTVTDCNFTGNIAAQSGGGMYNKNDSNSIVTNCIFSGNEANGNTVNNGGGGMYNLDNSNPTVTNCTFLDNTGLRDGGGMYNYNNSSPTVTNCTFSDNFVNVDGGGMYNTTFSSPMVANCIFWKNEASWGGGMYNYINSSPTVTNCTFSQHNALAFGGGILNNSSSSPTLTNCILWDNMPTQIHDYDSPASTSTVSFSDVQGGWSGMLVIDSDPFFVDAAGGDLRLLSSTSPCVDMGANGAPGLPATDLAGNPRIVDGDRNGLAMVDMGAYEYQSWLIHNITQDNWYETIQFAIDTAAKGDEIEVAPGTYNEAINFIGKSVRLYSSDGPEVTTIDANGLNSPVVTCNNGEDANTILEGFTITGGSGTTVSGYNYGGGMYNYSSSPSVTNCNFSTNSVTGDGGGMYNKQWSSPTVPNCSFTGNSAAYAGGGMDNRYDSSPIVVDCTFSQNTAGTDGGGMENNTRSNPTVINCLFTENTATSSGGGLSNLNTSSPMVTNCTFSGNSVSNGYGGGMNNYNKSTPTVSNCTFSSNTASINGGGICNSTSSSSTMGNCTFTGNTASYYGGGMYNYSSSPTVTNCIFNHNIAQQASGGGIANYDGSQSIVTNCTFSGNKTIGGGGGGIRNWNSSPTVTNCILWDNEPDEISSDGTSAPVVNYSDIQGGHIGTGNINTDPNFVDANNPDPNLVNLRLLPDSPCIDAGDTTAVPSGILVDADGNQRGLDDPASPDTGVNVLGVTVDMGAYEFLPCPIAGDINCDGVVDFKDVAILCANWLAGTEPEL
jgi:parallel beta-helix repeat protein